MKCHHCKTNKAQWIGRDTDGKVVVLCAACRNKDKGLVLQAFLESVFSGNTWLDRKRN